MTIADFQQHIRDKYYATDAARGTPRTFLWFIEEVGELATGLQRTKEAGLLKRKLLGAVSAKSPPASWNAAIERHPATEMGANGASIVRGERRSCIQAVDWSTLTVPGWPKWKSRPIVVSETTG